MTKIMKQCCTADSNFFFFGHLQSIARSRSDMKHAERVLKPGMNSARIDDRGMSKLLYSSESLHQTGFKKFDLDGVELNKSI